MNPLIVILAPATVARLIYPFGKAAQAHAGREQQRVAGLGRWAAAHEFALHPNPVVELGALLPDFSLRSERLSDHARRPAIRLPEPAPHAPALSAGPPPHGAANMSQH